MPEFVENAAGLLVPAALLEPGKAIVYCDESGNSGPNYVDAGQPFYVLAGWLVPDGRLVDVNLAIEAFRTRHFPQREELKSASVLRNDTTKYRCVELFEALGAMECLPLYLIAEKRYCIAAKIVETFLDPPTNAVLKTPFTGDVATKQEIANTLYECLPDAVLNQFAEAYRRPTAADLETALREVLSAVTRNVSPELAKAIAGCATFIDEIAQTEAQVSPLGNVAGTLNLPCLVTFLMIVENLARLGVATPIKLVHDEQHAYRDGYRRLYETHRKMPRLMAKLPHSNLPYSNLEHVAEFEMSDSKASVPIQAADLLAGAIHHCCKLAMSAGPVTDGDLALAASILPGLLVPEPRLTWPICSNKCFSALGRRIFDPAFGHPKPNGSGNQADRTPEGAPVFPVSTEKVRPETGPPRIKLDLPLYGLVGQETKGLMIARDPDAVEEPLKAFLLLFSTPERARAYLDRFEVDELAQPWRMDEFGPRELPELLGLLRGALESTRYATMDFGHGPLRLTSLPDMVDNLTRIFDRIRRVFSTGLDAVMLQRHRVGTRDVTSIQLRDGRYAAMISPTGTIYYGTSRESALGALQRAEKTHRTDEGGRFPA